ncbi:MAG: hypothetical protein EOP04_07270 [Proteobacteria bacterium]|nr:MAG: hypothetical protein EOP04_07270 [Pseudomonadota bacterium]
MQKRNVCLGIILSLAVSVLIVSQKQNHSEIDHKAPDTQQSHVSGKKFQAKNSTARSNLQSLSSSFATTNDCEDIAAVDCSAINDAFQFDEILRSMNLWSPASGALLAERFYKSDATQVGLWFKDSLNRDESARGRLIYAATFFPEEPMTDFWKDVLFQSSDNTVVLKDEYTEFDIKAIELREEISLAVENLRIIASRDAKALRVLESFIVDPPPAVGTTSIRKMAFQSLDRADPLSSLRILNTLGREDSLRTALTRN